MNRTLQIPSILMFAAALLGCHIEAVHPLSDPADTTHDARLSGTWTTKGKNGDDTIYLHLGKDKTGSTRAIWVAHEQSGLIRLAVFRVLPTQIGGHKYASVQMVDPENPNKTEIGYFFVKYSINANQQLMVWDVELRPAIEAGKLRAVGGRITDSTATLRHLFLAATDNPLLTEPAVRLEIVKGK
jgi:hypothetical protein